MDLFTFYLYHVLLIYKDGSFSNLPSSMCNNVCFNQVCIQVVKIVKYNNIMSV